MSKPLRPTLAALLGVASLSAAEPVFADDTSRHLAPQVVEQEELAATLPAGSLASCVESPSLALEGLEEADADATLVDADATLVDTAPALVEPATLGSIIEERLERAEEARRYREVDDLSTLWLTLARRGQLDRVVDRGEQFLNVALKNQRRSELRSESRALRRHAPEEAAVEVSGARFDVDERLDVERFVANMPEPYRTAVQFSLAGMNHREVAEEMGASHAAVRKWAQRLRERLGDPDTLLS